MNINTAECKAAGFTKDQVKKIESIARRLSRCAKEMRDLDIFVFGGGGSGSLRARDPKHPADKPALIIADIDGVCEWDGGHGSVEKDKDGLLRGE